MGLLESVSLQVEMPVGVRLPTAGSPQTSRKRDPYWEVVLLLLLHNSLNITTGVSIVLNRFLLFSSNESHQSDTMSAKQSLV